ncbi:hypothetical protein GCM10010423_07470 [Streptomyces levis]|uniref:Uncharacterized protein n=1 Tax=Streptomyces levis TaxID=285566 RepID=A0ABN3NBH0_9ACTN
MGVVHVVAVGEGDMAAVVAVGVRVVRVGDVLGGGHRGSSRVLVAAGGPAGRHRRGAAPASTIRRPADVHHPAAAHG